MVRFLERFGQLTFFGFLFGVLLRLCSRYRSIFGRSIRVGSDVSLNLYLALLRALLIGCGPFAVEASLCTSAKYARMKRYHFIDTKHCQCTSLLWKRQTNKSSSKPSAFGEAGSARWRRLTLAGPLSAVVSFDSFVVIIVYATVAVNKVCT